MENNLKKLCGNFSALLFAGLLFVPPYGVSMPYAQELVPIANAPLKPVPPDPFLGYEELKRICTCESGFTHYESDGKTVLRGRVNGSDVGICQINEYYHKERIAALGIDIESKEGNIEFAKHLYDKKGSAPWVWSKSCWGG